MTDEKNDKQTKQQERKARLARALRDNLRRRKAQSRPKADNNKK